MKDTEKTKEQLIEELAEWRQKVGELEVTETEGKQAKEELEEKERLLTIFNQMGQTILSSLDMDQILNNLAQQIVYAGIFRSLTLSVVDTARNEYNVVRNYISRDESGHMVPGEKLSSVQEDDSVVGYRRSLDDPKDLGAQAFRRGKLTVFRGWGNFLQESHQAAIEETDPDPKYKISYFIPIKQHDRVLAMLATGSSREKEEEVLHRIEVMQPLLDQVAIALKHAQLYENVQRGITERKQMEEELIRTQRLRAAGELSAGVSHNLNNILTGVLFPAQLLRRMTDDPDILQEAEEIVTHAQRAKDLVHRLHLSVRGIEEDTLTPISLNEVIQEAEQTARPRWKDEAESKGITIEIVTQLAEVRVSVWMRRRVAASLNRSSRPRWTLVQDWDYRRYTTP